MISVGLTGGIGSGKSTVSKFFTLLSVPVYNSDERAKYLMNNDLELKLLIKELLGDEAFIEENINKEYIANKIFQDICLRDSLNNIVHNAVFHDYINYQKINGQSPYIIQESAILFEGGYESKHQYMILVICSEDLRIKRLTEKGMSEKDIRQRMKNQWSDKDKINKSDYIIFNNEKNSLIEQVNEIHQKILINTL